MSCLCALRLTGMCGDSRSRVPSESGFHTHEQGGLLGCVELLERMGHLIPHQGLLTTQSQSSASVPLKYIIIGIALHMFTCPLTTNSFCSHMLTCHVMSLVGVHKVLNCVALIHIIKVLEMFSSDFPQTSWNQKSRRVLKQSSSLSVVKKTPGHLEEACS